MQTDLVHPSRVLHIVKTIIFFLLLSIAITLAIGLARNDLQTLLVTFFLLSPTFVFISALYLLIKQWQMSRKKKKLVLLLNKVADELESNPSTLTHFDIKTHNETSFVWDGVVTPFLIASVRLLLNAKATIISEQSGRHRQWTESGVWSPILELAKQTKKIAVALEESDPVVVFEALGDLFAYALLQRKKVFGANDNLYSQDDFLKDTENICILLKERRFITANNELKKFVAHVMCQKNPNPTALRWQAFIANWLVIRFNLMEAPSNLVPSSFWLGPSKLLSMQLDAVTSAYVDNNYTDIAEIIYESFDWRNRIPRFLAR